MNLVAKFSEFSINNLGSKWQSIEWDLGEQMVFSLELHASH